ncbi:hypothetical protein [Ammoniphilus sp. 3BR4]|uniref:hypothetical protein n=1 Tax=Ammoniphilus sp. 3BR4 TaxID=3158265 RepID=UPI0034653503
MIGFQLDDGLPLVGDAYYGKVNDHGQSSCLSFVLVFARIPQNVLEMGLIIQFIGRTCLYQVVYPAQLVTVTLIRKKGERA